MAVDKTKPTSRTMEHDVAIATLANRAYELGVQYEQHYKGCGQCMVGAVWDALHLTRDEIFQAATAFAGGIGMVGDGSCGAYIGGVLIIGDRLGRARSDFSDQAGIRFRTYALARQFHDAFVADFGSVTCRQIQEHVFGRAYNLLEPADYEAFDAAGAHLDKCPVVVGQAARLLVELLGREGLLETIISQ
jgi:C_GCAxxG_C_C family probable redox protein